MILYFYVILIYKFTQTQNISKSLQNIAEAWMGNRRAAPQSFAAQIPSMESANRVEWVRGFLSWDQTSKIQHISMTGLPWFEMILTWFWQNQDPCVDFDENNGHVIVFEFMLKLTCWSLIFAENIHYFDETMMLDTIQFGFLL